MIPQMHEDWKISSGWFLISYMNDDLRDKWKDEFEKISVAVKSITDEKVKAAIIFKDFIESLNRFPQWLSIFSGFGIPLGILDRRFLVLSFIFFLFSLVLILSIKRLAAKRVLNYINALDLNSHELSKLSFEILRYHKGEISENDLCANNGYFYEDYKQRRDDLGKDLGGGRMEGVFIDVAFWLSISGAVSLMLGVILTR